MHVATWGCSVARAPVAITRLRSGAVSTWTRGSDTAATCKRAGETYACGRYFIVNDYLPKPVMLLDSDLRVVNAVQYDPFGHPNRQALVTSVWYEPNANTVIGTCDPKVDAGSSLVYRTRVGYHSFDMEPNVDFMRYRDTAGTELGSDTGARGWAWSGWMTPAPADRKVNLVLQSNATNESAVNTQWCEYRASDAAVASPFWIPLRFPGQYWDRESDYFENWNRYYDPWTGRYLQPEPLMQDPEFIVGEALVGHGFQPYVYALNNSLVFTDPTGECIPGVNCSSPEDTIAPPDGWPPKKPKRWKDRSRPKMCPIAIDPAVYRRVMDLCESTKPPDTCVVGVFFDDKCEAHCQWATGKNCRVCKI